MIKFILGVITGVLLAQVSKLLVRMSDRSSNIPASTSDVDISDSYPDAVASSRDIVMSSSSDARQVLVAVKCMIREYGHVYMSDLCQLAGTDYRMVDDFVGWTDMDQFWIQDNVIHFSKPVEIRD